VKGSEFKRLLRKAGVVITDAKRHYRLRLADRVSFLPRHPSQELKTGTVKTILKQLGIGLDDLKQSRSKEPEKREQGEKGDNE
jgi:mRNA interferase HicA